MDARRRVGLPKPRWRVCPVSKVKLHPITAGVVSIHKPQWIRLLAIWIYSIFDSVLSETSNKVGNITLYRVIAVDSEMIVKPTIHTTRDTSHFSLMCAEHVLLKFRNCPILASWISCNMLRHALSRVTGR